MPCSLSSRGGRFSTTSESFWKHRQGVVGRAFYGDLHEPIQRPIHPFDQQVSPVKRTPVNPWAWSLNFGYNQAEIVEGTTRQLICAGQTAVDTNGNPQHPENMRKQITLALDNLEAVLNAADMNLANLTRLTIYTTDVDEAMKHFDVLGARFAPVDAAPPMTLLGVTRLAIPGLLFEIEATAAD